MPIRCNVNFVSIFNALNKIKKGEHFTLHNMGKVFISQLTGIKFKIWRVTFLKSFLLPKDFEMVFRFSHNRRFTTYALK